VIVAIASVILFNQNPFTDYNICKKIKLCRVAAMCSSFGECSVECGTKPNKYWLNPPVNYQDCDMKIRKKYSYGIKKSK